MKVVGQVRDDQIFKKNDIKEQSVSNDLLNCPFCGGEAESKTYNTGGEFDWHYIRCKEDGKKCLIYQCQTRHYETFERATKAWNTRAPLPNWATSYHCDVCGCADYDQIHEGKDIMPFNRDMEIGDIERRNIKIQLDVEIKPFSIPNFVTLVEKPRPRQEGFKPSDGIPLSELDEITLEKMCDEFRIGVFKKAKKNRPL